MAAAPQDVQQLAAARAAARAAKDFALADRLRDEIAAAGWIVADVPDGFTLTQPEAGPDPGLGGAPTRAADVSSLLEDEPTADVSVHWVVEGWPEDVVRAIAGFREYQGDRSVQYVVADVIGTVPDTYGADVEVVALEEGTGWAAARNAGLKRSRGRLV